MRSLIGERVSHTALCHLMLLSARSMSTEGRSREVYYIEKGQEAPVWMVQPLFRPSVCRCQELKISVRLFFLPLLQKKGVGTLSHQSLFYFSLMAHYKQNIVRGNCPLSMR